jgi:hypothetical protein
MMGENIPTGHQPAAVWVNTTRYCTVKCSWWWVKTSRRDTSQQQLGWTLPDTVNTVKCSWWWAKTSRRDTSQQQLGWTLPDTVNSQVLLMMGENIPTGHQPAATWMNTTRYCKYSQVLLMMGKTTRWHTSQQQLGRTLPDTVNTVKCSWWWAKTSRRDTSQQQLGWTLPDTVNTVTCSWWWAKTSPETCRTDLE